MRAFDDANWGREQNERHENGASCKDTKWKSDNQGCGNRALDMLKKR